MITLIKTVANFFMKFSFKTYAYILVIVSLLIISYRVYDAFQSKKKYVEVKNDLNISNEQIKDLQKLSLEFREKTNFLKLKIASDSLLIIEKDKTIVLKDSLLKTKDNQIIGIQKLIVPIQNGRKLYKDSLDNLKIEYQKLLKRSNRKGLFGRNINNVA